MTAASDIEALDDLWSEIEDSYGTMAVDERLSRLLRSDSVSHRFATVTQIAGHYFDRGRNPLVMQSSAAEPGAWDARSYCSNIIVPWLRQHDSPLGTSPDPYVNNPLRRPLIVARRMACELTHSNSGKPCTGFSARLHETPKKHPHSYASVWLFCGDW